MTPAHMDDLTLDDLETPCLLLDRARLQANLDEMAQQMRTLGVALRPHVKTHKSIPVWQETVKAGGTKGITVSTLAEAEHFFAAGADDILYAVGIVPGKLARAAALMQRGCDLTLTLDSPAMATALAEAGAAMNVVFKVLIELDIDDQRAGIAADSEALLDIASRLTASPGAELRGVMSHSGGTYGASSPEEIRTIAAREHRLALLAATRLRDAGHACPVVSVGSTPAALMSETLAGVTEVRAGVYCFFDMVQAGLGVCTADDVAISLLTSVIGHQQDKGWLLTDAGWMALSRDQGRAPGAPDLGYGAICDRHGERMPELIIGSANQEHGIAWQADQSALPDLPVGSLLRVLPNHACATAGQHSHYWLVDGDKVVGRWDRIGGW